ncbi:MAG: hypothetical protein ACYC0F_07610 [Rhodanobacter sp.]
MERRRRPGVGSGRISGEAARFYRHAAHRRVNGYAWKDMPRPATRGIRWRKHVSSPLPDRRFAMATPQPFLHAGFLLELEQFAAGGICPASWPPALAEILLTGSKDASPAARHLIQLLHARKAVLQAGFVTRQVADELRRHQKFVKPGLPSPHIVQLRRQQAAARQAASQARLSLTRAGAAFVREAGIRQPARLALDAFISEWMEANLPGDPADPGRSTPG